MNNNPDKKESFLFKKLDLAFVYLFIFIVGIVVVMIMTSYINNKVKEVTYDTPIVTNR